MAVTQPGGTALHSRGKQTAPKFYTQLRCPLPGDFHTPTSPPALGEGLSLSGDQGWGCPEPTSDIRATAALCPPLWIWVSCSVGRNGRFPSRNSCGNASMTQASRGAASLERLSRDEDVRTP